MSMLKNTNQTVQSSTYSATENLSADNATIMALTLPTGPTSGYVLTSNSSGVATWKAPALIGPTSSTAYDVPTFADTSGGVLLDNPSVQITGGKLITNALNISGGTAGYVLTSDSSGNGTWQAQTASSVYGYTIGTDNSTTAAGALVAYSLGASTFNVGFTSAPSAGGTSFVIATNGVYEFYFYLSASDAAGTSSVIQIGIDVNGSIPSAAYIFRSALATGASAEMVCTGKGLIHLAATNTVSLRNVSGNSSAILTYSSTPSGGVAGANRVFLVRRIA